MLNNSQDLAVVIGNYMNNIEPYTEALDKCKVGDKDFIPFNNLRDAVKLAVMDSESGLDCRDDLVEISKWTNVVLRYYEMKPQLVKRLKTLQLDYDQPISKIDIARYLLLKDVLVIKRLLSKSIKNELVKAA